MTTMRRVFVSISLVLSPLALTTASAAPQTYTVTYRLLTASSGVGALQWTSDYSATTGGFRGSAAAVECTNKVGSTLLASTDLEATRKLLVGIVTANWFLAPTDLVACTFDGDAGDPPVPADFPITIDDATDTNGTPISVSIGVTVSTTSASCGDGIPTAGEQCDDGNAINTDACTNTCQTASCSDGFVRAGVEQCDDGNAINTDACTSTCQTAKCGDGFIRAGVETCDDGNGVSTDACPTTCEPATCGDGFVRTGFEECDDANVDGGDGCSNLCEVEQPCGDATGNGEITASDALRVLQKSVGLDVECPTWACNVDGKNDVAASDALQVLRTSVGLPTVLACAEPTSIVIRATTATTLGALQFDVSYQNVSGEIDGSGSMVDCQALQMGSQAAFNDKPDRVLSVSVVSLTGIQGPGSLVRCAFTPSANVDPEDFEVTVSEATELDGDDAPIPGVKVILD